jgi:hypothetical protein
VRDELLALCIGCPHPIDIRRRNGRIAVLKGHVSEGHRWGETPIHGDEDCEAEKRGRPPSNDRQCVCHSEPRRVESGAKLILTADRVAMELVDSPVWTSGGQAFLASTTPRL